MLVTSECSSSSETEASLMSYVWYTVLLVLQAKPPRLWSSGQTLQDYRVWAWDLKASQVTKYGLRLLTIKGNTADLMNKYVMGKLCLTYMLKNTLCISFGSETVPLLPNQGAVERKVELTSWTFDWTVFWNMQVKHLSVFLCFSHTYALLWALELLELTTSLQQKILWSKTCSNVAFVSGGFVFSLYLCFLWDFKNTCFRLLYDSLLLQIGIMLGYAQLMHNSLFLNDQ